jgi:hypothetical protein
MGVRHVPLKHVLNAFFGGIQERFKLLDRRDPIDSGE